MKSKLLFSLLLVSSSAAAVPRTISSGVPAKSPKCGPHTQIIAPPNASGVYLNETCDVAFVLPPAEASVEVMAVAPNANSNLCPVVNSRMRYAVELQARIEEVMAKLNARVEAGQDPDDPFRSPRSKADLDTIAKTIVEVVKLQDDLLESLKKYSALEAATLQIVFNSKQAELTEKYRALNPGLAFLPLQLKTARLSVLKKSLVKAEALPAVLSADVPGIEVADLPATGEPLPDAKAGDRYSNERTGNYVFSHALSGSLTLSMVGACGFYNEKRQTIEPKLTGKDLTANLVANVSYSYELQAYAKYHAEYNLASLVKRMMKSTTSGGLFFTSTAVEMVNEKDSSDWFTFRSDEDDSDLQIGVTAKDVKADLIDRVLSQIGFVNLEGSNRIVDPAAPPLNGVSAASNQLEKCPHYYCQAAAIGLKLLDSAFGGSEAVQNFLATSNYRATDEVESRRMIRYRGSFSFVPGRKN